MTSGGERTAFLVERLDTLNETSQVSPAVASWNGQLHIAWTGRDRRLNVASSPTDGRFMEQRTFPSTSYQTFSIPAGSVGATSSTVTFPPALAATANGLHLAWTGSDGHLHVSKLDLRVDQLPAEVTLAETSSGPLSIAGLGGELVIGWTSRRPYADVLVSPINLLVSKGGRFLAPVQLRATSRYRPAVCAHGNQIVVAWTATDRRINVLFSPGTTSQRRLRLEEKSSHPPALSSLGDAVVLAWTGTDRHINLAVMRYRTMRTKVRLNHTTSHEPAICSHLGEVVLAWRGSHRRLNTARLCPTAPWLPGARDLE